MSISNETKLQDVIQTSLQNIKSLIDTNTIIDAIDAKDNENDRWELYG